MSELGTIERLGWVEKEQYILVAKLWAELGDTQEVEKLRGKIEEKSLLAPFLIKSLMKK